MSDVPELDKLLDEHHIFKTNISWERAERLQLFILRVVLQLFILRVVLAVCVTVFAVLAIGWLGVVLFPFVFKSLTLMFPDPPRKDPFVRYKRM
ncbi:hypothetical protein EBZ39_00525 [bacterium]|nr:hypothetical protein [bacterium]